MNSNDDTGKAVFGLAFGLVCFVVGVAVGSAGREAVEEHDREGLDADRARQLFEMRRSGFRAGLEAASEQQRLREGAIETSAFHKGMARGWQLGLEQGRQERRGHSGARTMVRGSEGVS